MSIYDGLHRSVLGLWVCGLQPKAAASGKLRGLSWGLSMSLKRPKVPKVDVKYSKTTGLSKAGSPFLSKDHSVF
jgi:hypothetical protein